MKSAERARRYCVMTVGTNRSADGAVFRHPHQSNHASCLMIHGPWFMAHGSWLMVASRGPLPLSPSGPPRHDGGLEVPPRLSQLLSQFPW